MRRTITLADRSQMTIVLPGKAIEALTGTCFRGPLYHRAWNLSRFATLDDWLDDQCIQMALRETGLQGAERLEDRLTCNVHTRHLRIVYPGVVGWEATVPRDRVPTEALEERHACRMTGISTWVRPGVVAEPARQTNILNVVYNMKVGNGHWVMMVWGIYPGPVRLKPPGQSDARRNVALYDVSHPGA